MPWYHGPTASEVVCASVDMASPLATPKSPELVSIELGASKALTVKLISFGYTRPQRGCLNGSCTKWDPTSYIYGVVTRISRVISYNPG